MNRRNIWVNEDDAHFYVTHPECDMNEKGLRNLVDFYARNTMVEGILFNIGMQKALYASEVWQALYEDYDPARNTEQPVLSQLNEKARKLRIDNHARTWLHNLWTLHHQAGIDQFAIWLDQCKKLGIQGWLTMRMNDCHGLEEYQQRIDGTGTYDDWALLCPSKFWKENPRLRRAPYRWERSWEGAYDYAHKEVRQHYLKFLEEALAKYDMDGIELDWMRWGMNFKPGHEQDGLKILTEFMRCVRLLAKKAGRRLKHPVKIGVRVPAEPQAAFGLGYDVPTWAKEGLIDQVVLSGFGGVANFNIPIKLWRMLLPTNINLLVVAEPYASACPSYKGTVMNNDYLCGSAASALSRGANGIYLFNLCYNESSEPTRSILKKQLGILGSPEKLSRHARRYAVSYPQVYEAGASPRTVLPVSLRQPAEGWDFGRMEQNISVRVYTGKPSNADNVYLLLGFSQETPRIKWNKIPVYINGMRCAPIGMQKRRKLFGDVEDSVKNVEAFGQCACFSVPSIALRDTENLLEFTPPPVNGSLSWVEMAAVPRKKDKTL